MFSWIGLATDAVLVLIVLAGIVIGYKRGFIKTVARPVKFAASVLLAYNLCTPIGETWFQPYIEQPLRTQLLEYLNKACADLSVENVADELPTLLKMAAGLFNVDVEQAATDAVGGIISAIVDALTVPVAHIIAIGIAFILIYFASKLVLSLVVSLINAICDRGIVGAINRVTGVIFSGFLSFLVCWLLVAAAGFVFGLESFAQVGWVTEVQGSFFYRFLRTYGPLDLLLRF